jgi:hypothetical protein
MRDKRAAKHLSRCKISFRDEKDIVLKFAEQSKDSLQQLPPHVPYECIDVGTLLTLPFLSGQFFLTHSVHSRCQGVGQTALPGSKMGKELECNIDPSKQSRARRRQLQDKRWDPINQTLTGMAVIVDLVIDKSRRDQA